MKKNVLLMAKKAKNVQTGCRKRGFTGLFQMHPVESSGNLWFARMKLGVKHVILYL